MGMSLPLLAKTLTNKIEKASEVTGYLYGFNTLGAAIGAFITTWFIVRRVGLNGAIQAGAVLNFISAIASILSLKFFKKESGEFAATNTSGSDINWITVFIGSKLDFDLRNFRLCRSFAGNRLVQNSWGDAEKHNVYVWSSACNFAWINGDRNTLRNLACKSKSKPGPEILRFSIRNHYLHCAFSSHLYRCTA